jgi:hypothetical protein
MVESDEVNKTTLSGSSCSKQGRGFGRGRGGREQGLLS